MRLGLIAVAVVLFVAVSAGVARWLTADNAERNKVEALLHAQLRGDPAGMLHELDRCTGGCVDQVRSNAARLRRPGRLEIAAYQSETSHALGADTGQTRVVWKTPTTLTVVQCVTVKRTGNPIRGMSVQLLGISGPIGRQSAC